MQGLVPWSVVDKNRFWFELLVNHEHVQDSHYR